MATTNAGGVLNRYAITVHAGRLVMLAAPGASTGQVHVIENPLELAAWLITMGAIATESESRDVLEAVRELVEKIEAAE